MAYIQRENNGKVYYETSGAGDTAIVLIHGWGANARAWDQTVTALTRAGFQVVTLDHRGCGRSDSDFEDLSISAIAGDVVALVSELGLKSVILNGWSIGAAVTVEAALALENICKAIVLTAGATPAHVTKPDYPHGGAPEDFQETVGAVENDRENVLPNLALGCFAEGTDDKTVAWLLEMFMESSPRATETLAELISLDQRQKLAELSVPALVMVGAQDAVVDPNVCRSVKDFHSQTTTIEFENSGHVPFVEEKEKYNATLLEFAGQFQN